MQHWNPESIKLPMYTPEQMNPFHQALAQGLNTYSGIQNAAYLPQQLESKIASQNAYAQNVGRQLAATVLGNPAAVSRMSDSQINGLLNLMSSNAMNVGSSPSGQKKAGLIPQLWDWSKNLLSPDQQSAATGSQIPSTNGQLSNANSGMSFNPDGTNKVATEQEVDQAVDRATGNNNQAPYNPATQVRENAQRAVSGNVMTGGGQGKGAGTTYVDPQTGQSVSSPTSGTTSSVQTALLTTERIEPYVLDLPKQYRAQFGLANKGKMAYEGIGSFVLGGIPTPTVSAYNQYNTDLTNAADGMLKELNLNNTTGNRKSMELALQHGKGESPDDYERRIKWLWKTIQDRDEKGRRILARGIVLNPDSIKTKEGREQLTHESSMAEKIPNKKILRWNQKLGRLE